MNKEKRRWVAVLVFLLALVILGIANEFTNNNDPENEIIGQKDAPTDIWVGEEVE